MDKTNFHKDQEIPGSSKQSNQLCKHNKSEVIDKQMISPLLKRRENKKTSVAGSKKQKKGQPSNEKNKKYMS